jgi:hypothetical protein
MARLYRYLSSHSIITCELQIPLVYKPYCIHDPKGLHWKI